MANALYDKGRQRFLEAQLNWLTDTIKVTMVDTAFYTFNVSHEFLSSVPDTARTGTPALLTAKTSINGAADGGDVTFAAVTGPSIEAIVIYKDTGDAATSPLIAFIDAATGLPITPNGGDIIITWDNGINKIFRI